MPAVDRLGFSSEGRPGDSGVSGTQDLPSFILHRKLAIVFHMAGKARSVERIAGRAWFPNED